MTPGTRTAIAWVFGLVCAGLFLGALFSNSQIVELLAFIAVCAVSVVGVITGLAGRSRTVKARLQRRAAGLPAGTEPDPPEQTHDLGP